MAFTYDPSTQLGQVRLLIADTDSTKPIFQDNEVQAFLTMESSGFLYVSGMAVAGGTAPAPAVNVTSVLRAAALGLDSLAANKSRLASVMELLDVKLSADKAAAALRLQAKEYRDLEANQGHFAIVEMVCDQFQARERVWKQLLRIEGGA